MSNVKKSGKKKNINMADQNPEGEKVRKSARPRKITYVSVEEEEVVIPQKPVVKFKGLKVTGILFLMFIISVACVYGGISYYYADKFFEGTMINGIDCSQKTAYQVEQEIALRVNDYSIEVKARNVDPQIIDGDNIGYHYTPNGEVLNLLKEQKPYEWIKGYMQPVIYSVSQNTAFDKEMLETEMKQLSCTLDENQIAPENAYVAFNNSKFEIVPETQGSELRLRKAYQALEQAVSGQQTEIDFNANGDVYVKADVVSTDPELIATVDAYNNFARASITYTFGEENVTLNGEIIKDWLRFDERGQLVEDTAAFKNHVAEYVAQLAAKYNTVSTSREFYTTSGRTVWVYGSAYGWQIDQAAEVEQLIQEIQSGTQIIREPVYSMRANSHGHNDLGNTYIEVDLSAQHMYYYQNGAIIFDSDIVSGNINYEDRRTPEGIYKLYYKKSPDVLRGALKEDGKYEYEAEVQYWMPFNGGIGFHDATWQPYFGGDLYLTNGSHGCINMPLQNAAILYEIIQYDVPIICFY